jgi:hypothetical protein
MRIICLAFFASLLTAGPAFADCASSTQATADAMAAARQAGKASTDYLNANMKNKAYCTAEGRGLMSVQGDALDNAESLALDTRKVCEAEGQPLSDIDLAISSIRTNKSTHDTLKMAYEFCH